MRTQVRSLTLLRVLRIRHCHELWCRLQSSGDPVLLWLAAVAPIWSLAWWVWPYKKQKQTKKTLWDFWLRTNQSLGSLNLEVQLLRRKKKKISVLKQRSKNHKNIKETLEKKFFNFGARKNFPSMTWMLKAMKEKISKLNYRKWREFPSWRSG